MIGIINTYSRTISQRHILPTLLANSYSLLTFNQRQFALMDSNHSHNQQPNNKKVTAQEANDYH